MSGRLHASKSHAATFWALVAVLVLLGILALAPPAGAATAGGEQTSVGNIVEFDQNITVPAGTTADSVVVFGGSATIAGTVRETVVGIGADVTLQPSARVGTADGAGDTSVVVVGGTLTSAPGATIVGDTTYEPLSAVRDGISSGFWEPIVDAVRRSLADRLGGIDGAPRAPRPARRRRSSAADPRVRREDRGSLLVVAGLGSPHGHRDRPAGDPGAGRDHRRHPRGDPVGLRRRGRLPLRLPRVRGVPRPGAAARGGLPAGQPDAGDHRRHRRVAARPADPVRRSADRLAACG